jgi:hypothetical protein
MILPATADQLPTGSSRLAIAVVEPQVARLGDHSQVGMAVCVGVADARHGADIGSEAHAHSPSQLARARAAPKIDLPRGSADQHVLVPVPVPVAGIDHMCVRADVRGDGDRLLELAFHDGIPLECGYGPTRSKSTAEPDS